jgi:hypothetical protein
MRFDPLRKRSRAGTAVVIISASCCVPGMQVFDDQARRVVQAALAETGIDARVEIMPATTAIFGGVPSKITAEIMSRANAGQMPMPAVLVNGTPVSYGVPSLEAMKAALLALANPEAHSLTGDSQ